MEDTLKNVIEKIRRHRDLYERNEMAVREHIVNPILKSLGWNPEDPEEVRPEFAMERGIPDYTLMKDGNIVLFIEVKKLSVDVEKKEVIRQLARYCFDNGVGFGVLTNGVVWVLFRAFQEGTTLSERIVWKIDIENDEPVAIIRRLSTISKNNVDNISILIKKLQVLDEIWQSLIAEPNKIIDGLIPIFNRLIREGYPDYEFESSEIRELKIF